MLRYLLRVLVIYPVVVLVLAVAAFANDRPAGTAIQEEVWAIGRSQVTQGNGERPGALTASTALPIKQFAAVQQGISAQTFERNIEE